MNRRTFSHQLATALGALAVSPRASRLYAAAARSDVPRVNGDRLNLHLRELAEFGKNPQGGVSRVGYTDADKQGREYAMRRMREASLDVRIDMAGNIIGRVAGSDPRLKPILFGSHIDSVPEGGNYDGTLGSLSAIESIQTMRERKIVTKHPLEVVIFAFEEGGLVGSRGMIGGLAEKDLALANWSGKTIRDGIAFVGGNPDRLDETKRQPGDYAVYLELHIEQGGTLEQRSLEVGIVQGIVGVYRWEVTVDGFANHAGTTAMRDRHDALLSAARFIEMVNHVVSSVPGRQVGTVGKIQISPNTPNVIPGKATLSLELRDLDAAKVNSLFETIRRESDGIGQANGTTIRLDPISANEPAMTDARVRRAVGDTAQALALKSVELPSGAGHDAQSMSRLAPMGMIFVPSVGGISHSPKEYTTPGDCVHGGDMLLNTILRLDQMDWSRPAST
ncbi:MAG TPA: Zn-dependent hydrolase [Gemmatimonadaceae bacterium]|jgi:N-carbamoyl-L-amino-acid hydrolase|nr:Zn-dependent hydrolase [Gemmatimonadaceae bacterium]